jgi:hypothetical protein
MTMTTPLLTDSAYSIVLSGITDRAPPGVGGLLFLATYVIGCALLMLYLSNKR